MGSTEAYYLALLFVHMPVGPFIIEQAYTDTNVVFALALFSYCFARSAMTLALLSAGLALALKQTMAVFLIFVFPILWPALAFGEYCVLLALSVASYGIFLIADAWSLIEDVAYFHLATPFRDDGLTLSSLLYRLRGVPLPAVASPIALLTGAVGWGVYTFGLNTRSVDPRFSARRLASVWVGFASTFLLVLLFSKHARSPTTSMSSTARWCSRSCGPVSRMRLNGRGRRRTPFRRHDRQQANRGRAPGLQRREDPGQGH